MKILQILIITAIFLSAELKLPTNFITEFNQTITNDKGKTIEYSGKLYFKQDINIYLDDLNSQERLGVDYLSGSIRDLQRKRSVVMALEADWY